jgi:hypothetical protein
MNNQNQTIEVKLGRPVNESSNRQIRLKEKEQLRAQGLIKRGRPAAEGSKNAYIKALREAKIANGIELRRGRPVVEGSKNAYIKALRQEKLTNGVELRRGRPANVESKHYQREKDLANRRINGTLKLGRPKSDDVVVKVTSKAKINTKTKVMS